jgi:hypothetical protein
VLLAAGERAEANRCGLDFFFGGAVGGRCGRLRCGVSGGHTRGVRFGGGFLFRGGFVDRRRLAEQARDDLRERRIQVGDDAVAVEGDSQ